MPNAIYKKFGDLQAIEIKGKPGAPAIVFLHGYGADAADLAPLARSLSISRDVHWLFLNGPLSLTIGPHHEGRAWFPISISVLQNDPDAPDWAKEAPPGLRKARDAVIKSIEAAGHKLSRTILGGFSQGAILATDVALRGAEAPGGLAVLSGVVVDEANWQRALAARESMSYFQSHGVRDPVLPISGADRLNALFQAGGLKGSYVRFAGQHEIPIEAQSALSVYLRSAVAALSR